MSPWSDYDAQGRCAKKATQEEPITFFDLPDRTALFWKLAGHNMIFELGDFRFESGIVASQRRALAAGKVVDLFEAGADSRRSPDSSRWTFADDGELRGTTPELNSAKTSPRASSFVVSKQRFGGNHWESRARLESVSNQGG